MKINTIYDGLIEFCRKKKSKWIIYFISFIESIFFPLPTDPFLVPYIIATKKFINLSLWVTIYSVVGGVVAYFLGSFFWTQLEPILEVSYPQITLYIQEFKNEYFNLGIIIILIGGFSPFPYKVTCIASGIVGINFILFIVFSLLSRGLRFFLVSYLIFKYGEKSVNYIRKNIFVVSCILLLIGIIFYFIKF